MFGADGTPQRTIGSGPGAADGELDGPEDVALSKDGRIAVVDAGNHRIVMFDKHGSFESNVTAPITEYHFLALGLTTLLVLCCPPHCSWVSMALKMASFDTLHLWSLLVLVVTLWWRTRTTAECRCVLVGQLAARALL